MQEAVVYFDGLCNLCNASVQFIMARDRKGIFKFASLQGDYALQTLGRDYIKEHAARGLVLRKDGKLYDRSSAALQISRHLDGLWPLLFLFWWIPKGFRDFVYGIVARNRYKWFGKRDACWLPSPEMAERFL